MKVKELKELLITPEGVSQEEFDNLEVLISNIEETNALNPTRTDDSGYVVFGGRCDEEGNPIGDDSDDEKYDFPVFLISI